MKFVSPHENLLRKDTFLASMNYFSVLKKIQKRIQRKKEKQSSDLEFMKVLLPKSHQIMSGNSDVWKSIAQIKRIASTVRVGISCIPQTKENLTTQKIFCEKSDQSSKRQLENWFKNKQYLINVSVLLKKSPFASERYSVAYKGNIQINYNIQNVRRNSDEGALNREKQKVPKYSNFFQVSLTGHASQQVK